MRTVQVARELLGHQDVSTTVNAAHVLHRGRAAVRSPADRPARALTRPRSSPAYAAG